MSQPKDTIDPQVFATGLLPLLKEYTEKVQNLTREARQLQGRYRRAMLTKNQVMQPRIQREYESLRFSFQRLSTPALEMARQASQLIQHGKVETLARLELALRLAEFEAGIQQSQNIFSAGPQG